MLTRTDTKMEQYCKTEGRKLGLTVHIDSVQEQEFGDSIIHAEISMKGKARYCWAELYESFYMIDTFKGNADKGPIHSESTNCDSIDPQVNILAMLQLAKSEILG